MILGLLHKHIANFHGTVAFARVVTALAKNMDNVVASATVQDEYHFEV